MNNSARPPVAQLGRAVLLPSMALRSRISSECKRRLGVFVDQIWLVKQQSTVTQETEQRERDDEVKLDKEKMPFRSCTVSSSS